MSERLTDANGTSRFRRIPASGINLFQLIYILIREYEANNPGMKAMNLSLGNPDLSPVATIRDLKAQFAQKTDYALHTYAEDSNLNRLAEGMVKEFVGLDVEKHSHLRCVPIPGIKTASALMPLACGLHLKGRENFTVVSNLPAYDVIGTWSTQYFGGKRVVWPLSPDDGMTLNVSRLKESLQKTGVDQPDLIFVIRPGNPASRGASEQEWKEVIEFCIQKRIRLVNDAAYSTLATPGSHVPLSQVAKNYPELEWAELLSVSKAFSDPGARLGAVVGSKEFIEDFVLIKGNTESGPVPHVMAAYGELLKDSNESQAILNEIYQIYRARLDFLVPTLMEAGLRPACETTAGFFTLWKTPDSIFDLDLNEEAKKRGIAKAEMYNRLVIERTGIVGVHFNGAAGAEEAFIRYAVCTDVLQPEFQKRFKEALSSLKIRYFHP